MSPRWTSGVLALVSIGLVIGLVILVRLLDVEPFIARLLARVDDAGWWGQAAFAVVVALFVPFMLPSVMLTLGAGFLFGVVHGSLLIVLPETIGATFAFLLARHGLGKRAAHYLQRRARLLHVSDALLNQGWTVIALIRMIPFFPFKLSNYLFGLTSVSLRPYMVGTFVGLWPVTLFNVYLGSIAADLMNLHTAAQPRLAWQWAIYVAGFVLSLVAMLYLTHRARQLYRVYANEENASAVP